MIEPSDYRLVRHALQLIADRWWAIRHGKVIVASPTTGRGGRRQRRQSRRRRQRAISISSMLTHHFQQGSGLGLTPVVKVHTVFSQGLSAYNNFPSAYSYISDPYWRHQPNQRADVRMPRLAE
jgi:hypothetical protein